MLISLEIYRSCDFPGGGGSGPLDPRMRIVDPLPSSVQVFSCNGSFSIARVTSDTTSKHYEVHDSGYLIWFYGL